MNNKLKVIDLLNRMRLFNDYRPNIDFKGKRYLYDKCLGNYSCGDYYGLFSGYCIDLILDDEIEIIEENKKIELPEKLDGSIGYLGWNSEAVVITNKINEIIDYLKAKEEREENE